MGLNIETFDNRSGGNSYYKAISHPLAAERAHELMARLRAADGVAVYDPLGYAEGFAAFYAMDGVNLAGVFVQDVTRVGAEILGRKAQPVTDLPGCKAAILLLTAFDADRMKAHIAHLVPAGCEVVTFDSLRLPDEMLTNPAAYLQPTNFATNFAFFRDDGAIHTRVVTANYWARYGATDLRLWMRLFDADGATLAEWTEPVPNADQTISIDSAVVRARFGLGDFTGQLFIHAIGATGQDVVKYALDTYGDDADLLSCTHDANAWPSDLYAGLPAPADGEKVVLWVQNSHPCPIPAGDIGLNRMGEDAVATLETEMAPYATCALDVAALLPGLAWPDQIEIRAGKHVVRPRYEIKADSGDYRIAHPNVERVDLKPDPGIAEYGNMLGKGYILPAPILPMDRFSSLALPTPMSTAQNELPVAVIALDPDGNEIARKALGKLPRNHAVTLDAGELMNGAAPAAGYGHMELVYDFSDGGEADGWLHGLFRYRNIETGNAAETSFGAHIFNMVMTYRNEPQSYTGAAPGLSTRLFLRLGDAPHDTMCHLIYPASTPWHGTSETDLTLVAPDGVEVARARLDIPCGGSRFWTYHGTFDAADRARAGDGAYVLIRDTTCRLFGYHGLLHPEGSFSLDHMFGF
jgi:hypothetical protein